MCRQPPAWLRKGCVFFSISLQLESNVKSSHKRKLRDSCFLEGHRAKTWISSPSQHWGSSPPGGRVPASLMGHQSAWKKTVLTRSTMCLQLGIHPFALQQTSPLLLLPIVSSGQCGFSQVLTHKERDTWCVVPILVLALGFIWDYHCPKKLWKRSPCTASIKWFRNHYVPMCIGIYIKNMTHAVSQWDINSTP